MTSLYELYEYSVIDFNSITSNIIIMNTKKLGFFLEKNYIRKIMRKLLKLSILPK